MRAAEAISLSAAAICLVIVACLHLGLIVGWFPPNLRPILWRTMPLGFEIATVGCFAIWLGLRHDPREPGSE